MSGIDAGHCANDPRGENCDRDHEKCVNVTTRTHSRPAGYDAAAASKVFKGVASSAASSAGMDTRSVSALRTTM